MGSRQGHGQHDVKAQESFGRCWPHGVIYLRCPFTVLFSQDTLLVFMKHHKVSLDGSQWGSRADGMDIA